MQSATYAVDGVEVGVIECVISGKTRVSRVLGVPGSKGANGMDFAGRYGVGECGVIHGGHASANIMQNDVLQQENMRIFVGFGTFDHEPRVVADKVGQFEVCLAELRAG